MKPLHLLALAAALLAFTGALAQTYTVPGTNITLTYTRSGSPQVATITDCNYDASGALTIPATLGGAPVSAIGDDAFDYCAALTSVTIGNGVTSIGERAFSLCTALASVTFAGNAPSLGRDAFKGAARDFKVLFYEAATGFPTPKWQGYPSEMLPRRR